MPRLSRKHTANEATAAATTAHTMNRRELALDLPVDLLPNAAFAELHDVLCQRARLVRQHKLDLSRRRLQRMLTRTRGCHNTRAVRRQRCDVNSRNDLSELFAEV